jgi:hypothetical protein
MAWIGSAIDAGLIVIAKMRGIVYVTGSKKLQATHKYPAVVIPS